MAGALDVKGRPSSDRQDAGAVSTTGDSTPDLLGRPEVRGRSPGLRPPPAGEIESRVDVDRNGIVFPRRVPHAQLVETGDQVRS